MLVNLRRLLSATGRQINRSGWLAWASIFVMTLAFFISSIFISIAYTSNLFLKNIENKPHIYVFFNSGTEEETIIGLRDEWLNREEIALIEYTSETDALNEFRDVQERVNPEVADIIRSNVLPPSLGIRLFSIDDAQTVIDMVVAEQQENPDIFAVRFSQETIDTISTLFYWLRFGGGILMGLLLLVIFFFTLLTIEFRTFSRAEEIRIMQLVGGSLWFIRSPFILEGAFYGMLGALISTGTIYGLSYYILIYQRSNNAVEFLYNFFGSLSWPDVTIQHLALAFLLIVGLGIFIGAFNSYLAIRRYIN